MISYDHAFLASKLASAMAQPSGARLLAQFKASFLHTSRGSPGLLGQLAALGRFNSTRRLEALARHRTLAICGSLDAVVPPANSESLQQRIPGAELTQWQNAGHFFWAHRPSEVAGLLARFLSECDLQHAGSAARDPDDVALPLTVD